ncbi:MAG: transglutaminase domain-containing protein [bacterium]
MVKYKGLLRLLIIIFLFFLFLMFTQTSYAADFNFDYQINSTLTSDFKLTSEYTVTITNNSGKNFISKSQLKYPYEMESVNVVNENGTKLDAYTDTKKDTDGNYTISVDHKPAFGNSAKIKYKLTIITKEAIKKKSSIYDISIPGLTQSDSVKVSKNDLRISKLLPPIKYTSKILKDDESTKKLNYSESDYLHYSFDNSDPLLMIIGDKTKYNFILNIKPEQNNLIYAPYITSKQKIIIDEISASPKDVLQDNEQNTVLSYETLPDNIQIKGQIEVDSDKIQTKLENTQSLDNSFWKKDPRLDEIINSVKSKGSTSEKLFTTFEYISKTIKYENKPLTYKRLSTSEILDNPKNLHSINISDLVVLILKSSGVECKIIGGFIDNNVNNEFKNNSLHYWIEYYDNEWGGWKSADPTMHLISSSDNYYDGIGLSHIGIFSTTSGWNIPNPGIYSIDASLVEGDITETQKFTLEPKTLSIKSGKNDTIEAYIVNDGNTLSRLDSIISSVDNSETKTSQYNKVIFPHQKVLIDIKIKNENPYEDRSLPITFILNSGNNSYNVKQDIKFEKDISTIWIPLIILSIIIILIASVIIVQKKNNKKKH